MSDTFHTDTPPESQGTELQQASTAPLGFEDFGSGQASADPLVSTSSGKRFNSGGLLIVGVIVVAVAALFSLRTMARVGAAVTGTADIERVIDQFLVEAGDPDSERDSSSNSTLFSQDRDVLEVLSDDYTQIQVPLVNVQFNPFILHGEGVVRETVVDTTTTTDPGAEAERLYLMQRSQRLEQIDRAADALVLKSVSIGSTPLALVNDQLVRIGDTLVVGSQEVAFEVTEIGMDHVIVAVTDGAFDIEYTRRVRVNRD